MNDPVADYIQTVVTDLDQSWTAWFMQNGYAEPDVGFVIIAPGETYTSNCMPTPVQTDTQNAYYCPTDVVTDANRSYVGAMVLPRESLRAMWSGNIFGRTSQVPGDFAAATILAHEFGHSVVDELATQSGSQQPAQPKNRELIADCFAGAWMNWADGRGILTDTDAQEAVAAIGAIGDTELTTAPHGTPAEREAAIVTGYSSGQPWTCVSTYWQ